MFRKYNFKPNLVFFVTSDNNFKALSLDFLEDREITVDQMVGDDEVKLMFW